MFLGAGVCRVFASESLSLSLSLSRPRARARAATTGLKRWRVYVLMRVCMRMYVVYVLMRVCMGVHVYVGGGGK